MRGFVGIIDLYNRFGTYQEENYIAKYLVKNEEIKTDNNICPDLPRSLINNKNLAEKEIILGVRKMKIEFEVKEEMQKADIILGIVGGCADL